MSLGAALTTRRAMLGGGAALLLVQSATPAAAAQAGDGLYGLMGKMTAQRGKRAELIAILAEGTGAMPGCLLYLIAEDRTDADASWISEVWKSKQHHDGSFRLPEVRAAIARARPLIAGFGDQVETRPVSGLATSG